MSKTIKITSWLITSILIVIVGFLAFLYFSSGYNMYIVRSESMKPAVNMGDLIITGPANTQTNQTIEPGTIITYEHADELVTHRVQSIDNETLVTKGDAVEDADPWPVKISNIKGIYLFKIPYVGYVTSFIQTKFGWFLSIIIPAALLVAWLAKDIVKEAFSTA
ncbi:signal peptidase I [Chloroflexota bacterium]